MKVLHILHLYTSLSLQARTDLVVRHNFPIWSLTGPLSNSPTCDYCTFLPTFLPLSGYQVKPSLTQLPQKGGNWQGGDIMSGAFPGNWSHFVTAAARKDRDLQNDGDQQQLREASWPPVEEASRFHLNHQPP